MEKEKQQLTSYIEYLQTPVSREGTGAEKYELRKRLFGREDVLPMWVADMDLPVAPFIQEAIQRRAQNPIYGYTLATNKTYQAVVNWHADKGLICQPNQIEFTHNVANAFHMAVLAFTAPGDAILIQPPVYPPFFKAPLINNRQCIESPLKLIDNRYEIDFDDFEKKISDNNVKLFLFCNPQNPSGRVWLKKELQQLAEICIKYNVIIISDEIHSSLTNPCHTFVPLASLSQAVSNITVTLDSPGKVFNLGGLQIGYTIIQNEVLLKRYRQIKKSVSVEELNLFAISALEAAYTDPKRFLWISAIQTVIQQNIDYLREFISDHFPEIIIMKPEASYLVWLDLSHLFTTHKKMNEWLINEAQLGLNDGLSFSGESKLGEYCVRMNIAVPKRTMIQACKQMERARKR